MPVQDIVIEKIVKDYLAIDFHNVGTFYSNQSISSAHPVS